MSTFIINLNDTIAMSDSAMVELANVISNWHPYLQEVETNDNDVKIVAIICGAIILLAIIAAIVITLWHNMDVKTRRAMETEKVNIEKELKCFEASRKEAEERNRLVGHFQKTIFDKIVAKNIENENPKKEEDWKNLYKKIADLVNNFLVNFKV